MTKRHAVWWSSQLANHLAETHVFLPKIELFSAVAVCCLVCCRPMFLLSLVDMSSVTLKYISSFLWILACIIANSVIFHRSAMILAICDLEHDRNWNIYQNVHPKPSTCVPNMVIDRRSSQTIWLRYMKNFKICAIRNAHNLIPR